MKSILHQIKSVILEFLFLLIPSLFVIGTMGLIFYFVSGNSKGLEVFALLFITGLALFYLCLHWNRLPSNTKSSLKDIKYTVFFINEVTAEGFCLRRTDFDANNKDPYTIKDRLIEWRNIKDIVFDAEGKSLSLLLKNTEKLILPNTYTGWYSFIREVPKESYPSFDLAQVHKIYDAFEACKICSAIAVVDESCQNCYGDVWQDAWLDEGFVKLDYLKEEQLSHFGTEEEGQAIDFTIGFFDRTSDWELLVSEAEIMEYSADFFW